MGNQPSSGEAGSSTAKVGRFMRTTGLLGLSKAELDERCRPSGLYPSCNWEDKAIRKLIGDGKLAARLKGTENRTSATDRECPICFLQYREVNMTKCCNAYICTECYLQVRPQKSKAHPCPFCNCQKVSVTVAQAMNAEAMLAREETEQRVIEAKIRERAAQAESNSNSDNNSFGSSLQNDERVATLRARSSSLSDHQESEAIPEDVLRESFAMTPEERRRLEDEMRAQHSHPLSLRLEAEAEERRLRNEQEFFRQNPTQMEAARARTGRRSGRNNERRNWNQIVEAFERGGHGEVNSLDDLVVLEAAMILSMEEESRRSAEGENRRRNAGENNNNDGDGTTGEFDAYRHAEDGFPLVRSILSGRQDGENNEQLQALANNLYRRRSRQSIMRAFGGAAGNANGTGNLDAAGFLMGGMSEEDQIAMAIAASMQDQQQQQSQESGGEEASGEGGENNNNEEENTATGGDHEQGEENAGNVSGDEVAAAGEEVPSDPQPEPQTEEAVVEEEEAPAEEATSEERPAEEQAEEEQTEMVEEAVPEEATPTEAAEVEYSAVADSNDADEEAVEQAPPPKEQPSDGLDRESHVA